MQMIIKDLLVPWPIAAGASNKLTQFVTRHLQYHAQAITII